MADFAALVNALMSNDNSSRMHAEVAYEQLKVESPSTLVTQLGLLLKDTDAITRAFAPVLLRTAISGESGIYTTIDQSTQLVLKTHVLDAVATEQVAHVRRKLCHLIASVASSSHKLAQQWPELLALISALSDHPSASVRETALDLVAVLAEYVGDMLIPHKESFLTLFTNAFNDANAGVQISSLKASCSFLMTLDKREEIAAFGIIIAPMMRILELLIQTQDEVTLREVLLSLEQIAEVHPTFFRHVLDDVARAMLFIVSSTTLDRESREAALEFVVTLCENAGGMVRKSPLVVKSIVPLVMKLQTELDDDDQWVYEFDDAHVFAENADCEENIGDAAAEAVDRLSSALGGAAVLPVAIPVIKEYLRDHDWKKRRAGLYTISLLGEGSKVLMYRELDNVVAMVMPFLGDVHPRVQYTAVHCIGQMAEEFGVSHKGRNFQARYHNVVLPALTTIIHNDGVLRTRALAASVIINFCNINICKALYVKKHTQPLLEALFHAMRTCPRQVQEQAITAVASVAKVIGVHFDRFYPIFMPVVKDVLMNAVGSEFALLRGKAMESIALIGEAVGKERFVVDAKEVMEILVRVHVSGDVDGPEVQYVAQSCVRIGSILKEDFVPYLPYVVPPLLKQASIEPDVVLTDILNDEVEEHEDVNGAHEVLTVEVIGGGKKRLQINTSALQDKTNACNMLYQCALDLEGAFYPYVQDVATVVLPLLNFEYVEDIRIVSGLTLARLLASAVDGTMNHGYGANEPRFQQQLFQQFLDSLLKALLEEDELEVRGALAEATSALLEVCNDCQQKGFDVALPIELTPRVVEVFKSVATRSAQGLVTQQAENHEDEDFDEESELQQSETLELEEGIFRAMIDSCGWLIKMHREAFFPVFKTHLLSFVLPLLELESIGVLRGQAICMIDDIIEHCGVEAQELVPMFIGQFISGLDSSSTQVMQASAYGVGICAEKNCVAFMPFCQQSFDKLVTFIDASASVDDDEVGAARDNAVSAVAKILLLCDGEIDAGCVWPTWLTWLPLRTDVLEARDLHGRFISWIAEGNKSILGREFERLGDVIKVFAAIIMCERSSGEEDAELDEDDDMDIISDKSKSQLRELLANLQTHLPSSLVQGAWDKLTADEQRTLMHLS